MNHIELPYAVRLTAAAFAVFMTTTMLDGMVSLAGPEQSHVVAHGSQHGPAAAADAPQRVAAVTPLAAAQH